MIERLLCALFDHRYVILRILSHDARKVGCTRCGEQWGMHDGTRAFIQWDDDLEELYSRSGVLGMSDIDTVRANKKGEDVT